PFGDLRRVLMSLAERAKEDSAPKAHFLRAAAFIANSQNDFGASATLSRENLRIGTLLKEPQAIAWSLTWLAIPLGIQGKITDALEAAQSAVSLARSLQSRPIELVATTAQCNILGAVGQPEKAIMLGEEALAISKERGELWARGYLRWPLHRPIGSRARGNSPRRRLAMAPPASMPLTTGRDCRRCSRPLPRWPRSMVRSSAPPRSSAVPSACASRVRSIFSRDSASSTSGRWLACSRGWGRGGLTPHTHAASP